MQTNALFRDIKSEKLKQSINKLKTYEKNI